MNQTDEPDIEWSSLPGYDGITTLLSKRSRTSFTMIRRLTVQNTASEKGFQSNVFLELAHNLHDNDTITLTFLRCSQIRIDDTFQICGLGFRDVSQRGWEFTKYEVYDYEESNISLFCDKIQIERTKNIQEKNAF